MPHVPLAICAFVLGECAHDTELAVDRLLAADADALAALAAAAEAAAERSAAEASAAARSAAEARKATVRRYQQTVDRTQQLKDGEKLKLEPPRLPYNESRKEALRGPKLLYQNGEAVWTKGGKPPPTEEKEEWDGGSRGKVITKGKRGPGFR